jgi:signal transduction histidine kinase/CheY-like chemotaxis protein
MAPFVRIGRGVARRRIAYLVALGGPVLLLFVKSELLPIEEHPFTLFFLPVIVASWLGGLAPGLVAVALGALFADYYTPPVGLDVQHPLPSFAFMLEGAAASWLIHAFRRVQAHLEGALDESRDREQALAETDARLRAAHLELARVSRRAIAAEQEKTKQAEDALRSTEEQLRQSQKMEAVGRLAGGVAHDFNNMLSVILSYSSMLSSELEPDDPNRADIEEIHKAGVRAAALTRQLLAFSRQQVLEPRVVKLEELVTGMRSMLDRLVGEDVELAFVGAAANGRVKCDPGQMEQVVMNLVVNARDAMPDGGRLTIETADVELDEDYAREHLGVKAGPHVMLAVSDTGLGMDAATRARIFDPFFTTKEAGKGTGLGLSTVYGIVQQSNGSVWVYSEPGRGTTFKIYLPRTDASAARAADAVRSEARRGTETVLLVEDEPQLRALARGILARHGYDVLEAANGHEALLVCERHEGPIQALLTDVVMPKMNGRELADRVAHLRPDMRVLFMSGYTANVVVHHGVPENAVAFLQKPLTPESVLAKLRAVLDGPARDFRIGAFATAAGAGPRPPDAPGQLGPTNQSV